MAQIHPTAIVEDGARLAEDVRIGPYSVNGAEGELGDVGLQVLRVFFARDPLTAE